MDKCKSCDLDLPNNVIFALIVARKQVRAAREVL